MGQTESKRGQTVSTIGNLGKEEGGLDSENGDIHQDHESIVYFLCSFIKLHLTVVFDVIY